MTENIDERLTRLRSSWEANAEAWTVAVRDHQIPSRRAGTDAAIVRACEGADASRTLDVGCGEGWLTRALASPTRAVHGTDASVPLIERARSAPNPEGAISYSVLDYAEMIANSDAAAGPWTLIVCNFALLGDPLVPTLSALRSRLAPHGTLLIQTVHPWIAKGDAPYQNGWREERFAGFGVAFPSAMPWFFRTLASWLDEIQLAGLAVRRVQEPVHADTGVPLSLLIECVLR